MYCKTCKQPTVSYLFDCDVFVTCVVESPILTATQVYRTTQTLLPFCDLLLQFSRENYWRYTQLPIKVNKYVHRYDKNGTNWLLYKKALSESQFFYFWKNVYRQVFVSTCARILFKIFQQGQLCHPSTILLDDTLTAIRWVHASPLVKVQTKTWHVQEVSQWHCFAQKRFYHIPPHHYFKQIHTVPFTETMLPFVSCKKCVHLCLHRVFESYWCFQYEPSSLYYTFTWYHAIPCHTKNTSNIYSNLQPIATEANSATKKDQKPFAMYTLR